MGSLGRLPLRAITIASFNANGLASNIDELKSFVVEHAVDVLLVQETFLKPHHKGCKIPNYEMIRTDRLTSALGGTAIYYRRNLHITRVDAPSLCDLEVTICRVAMTGHSTLYIASTYLPPKKSILQSDLANLFALGDAVILFGDFNSKHSNWNCSRTNRNGLTLVNMEETLDFNIIHPPTPTRYPVSSNHVANTLDIALLKGVTLQLCSIDALPELISDHRPVLLQLGPPSSLPSAMSSITDWNRFSRSVGAGQYPALATPSPNLGTPDEINITIDSVTSALHLAVKDASKEVPQDSYRWKLPEDVRELLRLKRAATRAHDTFPTDENRSRLRALQRQVKSRFKELRDSRWENFVSNIAPSHTAYWKVARSLKVDSIRHIPPLLGLDGSIAFEDREKAECLAANLEAQCSVSRNPCNPAHIRKIDEEVESFIESPPLQVLRPVSADEILLYIKNLHPKKAPGLDGITNKVLKSLPPQTIALLARIFNACFSLSFFPPMWKEAKVIGIPKPGKLLSDPANFRPISLISSIGKLYEKSLAARLKSHLYDNGIIINEQFGFNPEHSCPQQIHRIVEYAFHNRTRLSNVDITAAVFFDIAKAFDKVWHNGLIHKLVKTNVPDTLIHIIRDYLSNRSFCYAYQGTLSSLRNTTAGVPQGSVLAPTLFSVYVNDLPSNGKVQLALFADDTALYLRGRNIMTIRDKLQVSIDRLGEWFKKWRIEVNPTKSSAILFHYYNRFDYRPSEIPNLYFHSQDTKSIIPWKNDVKYLGVTLDRRLNFKRHIRIVSGRARYYLRRLDSLLGRRSKMSLRNKTTLYKACIRPVMTYASPVFAHIPKRALYPLQVVQNMFLRRATNCPYYVRNLDLHRDLEIPPLSKYFKEASTRFFEAELAHRNPLISSSASYDIFDKFRFHRFFRRPKYVLTDPDDELTAEFIKQIKLTDRTRPPLRKPAFCTRRSPHAKRPPRKPPPGITSTGTDLRSTSLHTSLNTHTDAPSEPNVQTDRPTGSIQRFSALHYAMNAVRNIQDT